MGAFHQGHMALIREGRRLGDRLVVSIFVNPTQFGPNEDFEAYPRVFESDCRAAREAGVDVVFAPPADLVYPQGFQTYIDVEELSRPLCGEHRPGHFRGVATVVLKLFTIVQPSVAVLGWKDAQQFIVLRRMAQDLNLPVRMVGLETVREADGLAMSSRNRYLSDAERAQAPAMYRGLRAAAEAFNKGERNAATLVDLARREIESRPLFRIQYLETRSIDRLEPLEEAQPGNTLIAAAAYLGATRLIDNVRL
jgi:pantoate--beta-alanine ligase